MTDLLMSDLTFLAYHHSYGGRTVDWITNMAVSSVSVR